MIRRRDVYKYINDFVTSLVFDFKLENLTIFKVFPFALVHSVARLLLNKFLKLKFFRCFLRYEKMEEKLSKANSFFMKRILGALCNH